MVSQDCVLFARSVRENIKYGVEASDEEMFRVAQLASAHNFILKLPNGYDTGQTRTEEVMQDSSFFFCPLVFKSCSFIRTLESIGEKMTTTCLLCTVHMLNMSSYQVRSFSVIIENIKNNMLPLSCYERNARFIKCSRNKIPPNPVFPV